MAPLVREAGGLIARFAARPAVSYNRCVRPASRLLAAALLLGLAGVGGCASVTSETQYHADSAWVHGDRARALAMIAPAAERGEAWAELRMGNAYGTGQGVTKDPARAVEWYRRAAVQERAAKDAALIAQHQLARHYLRGEGVTQDLVKAYLLVRHVEEKSGGEPIFFCCGFVGGSYLRPEVVRHTLAEIEDAMPPEVRRTAEAQAKGWTPAKGI